MQRETQKWFVINDTLSASEIAALENVLEQYSTPERIVFLIDRVVPPNSPAVSNLQKRLMSIAQKYRFPFYYGRAGVAELMVKTFLHAGDHCFSTDPVIARVGGAKCTAHFVSPEEFFAAMLDPGLPTVHDREIIELTGRIPEESCAVDVAHALAAHLAGGNPSVLLKDTSDGLDLDFRMAVCGALGQIHGIQAEFSSTPMRGEIWPLAQAKPLLWVANTEGHLLESTQEVSIKSVFIGGPYGGSLKDLQRVAEALQGRQIAYGLRCNVSPASADIYVEAADLGYLTTLMDAGALILNPCATIETQARVGFAENQFSNDWSRPCQGTGAQASTLYLGSTSQAIKVILSGSLGGSKNG